MLKNSLLISVLLILILTINFSCLNKKTQIKEDEKDFDLYLLRAQEFTKVGKFQKAIDMLNEAMEIFPNYELITLFYNIGFNYYKLNKNDDATKYLNRIITIFESGNLVEAHAEEDRKFLILSEIILEKMDKDSIAKKDPYHIKEDLQKMKKIKPKKK